MAEEKEKIKIKLLNVRHPFNEKPNLTLLVSAALGIAEEDVMSVQVIRRSVDARQERLDMVYTLAIELVAAQQALGGILQKKDVEIFQAAPSPAVLKIKSSTYDPIIIGCGPSGLFAALMLIERGARPILIERGSRMNKRIRDVNRFWKDGVLNAESNVLFGEGGAGTFSDGKLTTRIKSPLKEKVLHELVKFGAPEEIRYVNKPHLGTDRIRQIISAVVENLDQKGVRFLFETKVQAIEVQDGHIQGIRTEDQLIKTNAVFLGSGLSAREICDGLKQHGAVLEAKGFAVGLRIEHPQEFINREQWGKWAGTSGLEAADYFLTYHDAASGRGVYTFCMCPGGYVIACSSRQGELLTNGMSAYRRDSAWANAAVVVTVGPDDFIAQQPLAGISFQQQLEEKAFIAGGGNFMIPAQTARDFVGGGKVAQGIPACSCLPGAVHADLGKLLPDFLAAPLKRALMYFDKKMPGFIDAGTLFGVESRTSSPVRIKRNPNNFHAVGVTGLIPIGEGSGYAGGIMSCAVDGMRAALSFDQG
jgi:uncharacterized FAD-dependent dehydrogenase